MRIIAGTARGTVIDAPLGRDTRPTLDRVRENVFNILQQQVRGARVLDLFSGSGAMAFEAVSRGAASAVLVDVDKKAHQVEETNCLMTQDMNQREVSLLVVDMRYNGGGNSLLGNMLLEALNIHLSISISYGNTTNTKKALDYMDANADADYMAGRA